MKFEHTQVWGFEHAIRGMRNPMESWDKSDSKYCKDCNIEDIDSCNELESFYTCIGKHPYKYVIGNNDLKLMQKLIKAGSEHRKFMRQIFVSVDITAPLFWWKEFDTYKVGTVRNSCSTMHKIHVRNFTEDNFTHYGIDKVSRAKEAFNNVLNALEYCRTNFNDTQDKIYWRAIIELLPDGYNMKTTITLDYENLFAMCSKGQRRFHKQNEWSGIDNPELPNFISWVKMLPYAKELIFLDESNNETNNNTSKMTKEKIVEHINNTKASDVCIYFISESKFASIIYSFFKSQIIAVYDNKIIANKNGFNFTRYLEDYGVTWAFTEKEAKQIIAREVDK